MTLALRNPLAIRHTGEGRYPVGRRIRCFQFPRLLTLMIYAIVSRARIVLRVY